VRPSTDSLPIDASSVGRLTEIDDQLAGLGPSGKDDGLGDAELTPELAEGLDMLLLLRMVAAGDAKEPPAMSIGKYRVVHKLGEGGFAEVFEVIDTKLIRREALKIARPEILLDPRKTKRFLREAKHAAKISHPNVVIVHEVGEHDGLPYIAQELCGESLASWLDRHAGAVSPLIAARVVQGLAEAVHAAHAVGVIHRDIKPGNILLVPSDDGPLPADDRPGVCSAGEGPAARGQRVKLGDFGLSTSISSTDQETPATAPTEIGTVLGTPEWMAPEQVNGTLGPVDTRTDVHALGLVLDRLLTGRCVNAARSREEIYRRILEVEPEPADRVVPGIHPDLVAVCGKCLAKQPGDRYSSAAELAVDLSRFLDGRPTIARPLTPAQHAVRWLRRNPTLAGAIAASVVALLLGGLVVEERARSIAREKEVELKDARDKEAEVERQQATAAREAEERADKAARDAARDLRRAFESYRNGNAAGAVDDLRKSAAADPALADSLAGGWLLARTHGEIALLVDHAEKAKLAGKDALQIHSIALSPNGDRLAAGAADGTLMLVPLATDGTAAGAPVRVDAGHEINQVVFSPDGAVVATAGKLRGDPEPADAGRVRLWNANDGSQRRDVAVGGPEVFSVAFSPSGERVLWGGAGRAIHGAAVSAGEAAERMTELRLFDDPGLFPETDPDPDIEMISFLDEKRVLVAVSDRVCLVDTELGIVERDFRGNWGHVQSLSLSPDGRRLIAGGWHENMVRVWDVETGSLQLELESHPAWINGCGFSPDGHQIVTGCKDGVLRVFSATTGAVEQDVIGHVARIWSAVYHPSGRILTAGGDGTVRLWDPAIGPSMMGVKPLDVPGLPTAQSTVDLGEGDWLITPRSGAPFILGPSGQLASRIDLGDGNEILSSAVDRSSRRVAFATAEGLAVHRLSVAGEPDEVLVSPNGQFTSAIAFGAGGWLYQGLASKPLQSLMAWPADLCSPQCLDDSLDAGVSSIAIAAPPNPRLAFATGARVRVHQLQPDGAPVAGGGRQLADLSGILAPSLRLAWSADGERLAVGSDDGRTMILDADSGLAIAELASFATAVRGIVWAHNRVSIIVADEKCVRLCDAVTSATLDEIRPGWAIRSIALVKDHDHRQLLVVTGNRSTLSRRPFGAKRRDDTPVDGRVLLFDISRRLPAGMPRSQ
jgi:serine/threonine protein kinase/WD40 repeat protein